MRSKFHTLLINCPDEIGLMAKITSILYKHHLNITNIYNNVETQSKSCIIQAQFEGPVNVDNLLINVRQKLPLQSKISIW
jgi:formyltetrahydrofolate deformylase